MEILPNNGKVVRPGETTPKDVEWWYRERIAELKLGLWFHPHVSAQRKGTPEVAATPSASSDVAAERALPAGLSR